MADAWGPRLSSAARTRHLDLPRWTRANEDVLLSRLAAHQGGIRQLELPEGSTKQEALTALRRAMAENQDAIVKAVGETGVGRRQRHRNIDRLLGQRAQLLTRFYADHFGVAVPTSSSNDPLTARSRDPRIRLGDLRAHSDLLREIDRLPSDRQREVAERALELVNESSSRLSTLQEMTTAERLVASLLRANAGPASWALVRDLIGMDGLRERTRIFRRLEDGVARPDYGPTLFSRWEGLSETRRRELAQNYTQWEAWLDGSP